MKLKRWALVYRDDLDVYSSPEQRSPHIAGKVYDSPNFADGERVITSRITNVQGKIVTTASKNIYTLEDADPDYVKWCKEHNLFVPTTEQPILTIEDEDDDSRNTKNYS